jgi:hypothetical protein
MTSDVFDTKFKTSLPDIRLEIIVEKSVDPSQRNDTQTDPGWSGRGWWRDPCPRTDPPTLTMRDLKKRKNINTHPIVIVLSSIITLSYFTLAWQSN